MEPVTDGENVTLRLNYTNDKPCTHFLWKRYFSDTWEIIPDTERYVKGLHELIISTPSRDDEREYLVQCCDFGQSNTVSLNLSGKCRVYKPHLCSNGNVSCFKTIKILRKF